MFYYPLIDLNFHTTQVTAGADGAKLEGSFQVQFSNDQFFMVVFTRNSISVMPEAVYGIERIEGPFLGPTVGKTITFKMLLTS